MQSLAHSTILPKLILHKKYTRLRFLHLYHISRLDSSTKKLHNTFTLTYGKGDVQGRGTSTYGGCNTGRNEKRNEKNKKKKENFVDLDIIQNKIGDEMRRIWTLTKYDEFNGVRVCSYTPTYDYDLSISVNDLLMVDERHHLTRNGTIFSFPIFDTYLTLIFDVLQLM